MFTQISFYSIFGSVPFHQIQRDDDNFVIPNKGDSISVITSEDREDVEGVVKELHYIYGAEGTLIQIWIEEDG